MNKIIVGSNYLYCYLYNIIDYIDTNADSMTNVIVHNKTLTIAHLHSLSGANLINVESQNNFDCHIPISAIKKLSSFLKIIQDQPITLKFNSYGGISIKSAILS